MKTCTFMGCEKTVYCKGFCVSHYQKNLRCGTPEGNPVVPKFFIDDHGYRRINRNGKKVREHILIAEKAVGRKLPKGVVVHHVNGNRADNRNENLVVCQDQAYHSLLHRRQRALDGCGNADFFQCGYCRKWDAQENLDMKKISSAVCHRECANEYKRRKYWENKAKNGK